MVQVKSPEVQECLETVSNNFLCHIISLPATFHQISPCVQRFIICTSLRRGFPRTRDCLSHCASCHHEASECTPPAGQSLGSALKYQRKMNASENGRARSIVAVKTVLKKSRRKQALSAPIQRQRKLIAAAKRSRNQVDLSLLDRAVQQQKKSTAGRRAERLSSVLLQQSFLSGSADRQQ